MNTVSVRKFSPGLLDDNRGANYYRVTVSYDWGSVSTHEVHTNQRGEGLWVDGCQVLGTCQFSIGRNANAAIRRYFYSRLPRSSMS